MEVEKIIEVPVEKIVYRDRDIIVENIKYVEIEKIIEKPVIQEKVIVKEIEKII